jgi:hypothetical protein
MIERICRECCIDRDDNYDAIIIGILAEIYNAGLVHQARVDREAVEKYLEKYSGAARVAIKVALAALAAVAPEEGK